MKPIRQQMMALYNIEWQILRVNLSFRSADSITGSLGKLEEYLAKPLEGYDTRANRLWRVINLLNATVMGLRGQIKRCNNPARVLVLEDWIKRIQNFREPYSVEYAGCDKKFAWESDAEWNALEAADKADILAVYKSLTGRKKFAAEYKKMEVAKTRPELLHYIKLLTYVIEGRKLG